jgi:2-keto-3-deoxy-L-rhamnonate aldolase RhmA
MEHGAYDLVVAADIAKIARLEGICPLVRVPDSRYAPLGRMFDIGMLGLMVPRVETRDQVEQIVAELKYPPVGRRGCSISGGTNEYRSQPTETFIAQSNQETLVIVQIERRQAVEDIDALLSVEGVDVAFLGPGDLSIDLGVPGQSDHPIVVESMDRVLEACERHDIVPGIHLNQVDALEEWMHKGARMITWSTDIWMLRNAGSDGLRRLREAAAYA